MALTKILPCDCLAVFVVIVKQAGAKTEQCPRWEVPWYNRENGAKYQDAKYGKGMRLHNERFVTKTRKHIGWTCSCCGKPKLD